jgi:hypothetical protein
MRPVQHPHEQELQLKDQELLLRIQIPVSTYPPKLPHMGIRHDDISTPKSQERC